MADSPRCGNAECEYHGYCLYQIEVRDAQGRLEQHVRLSQNQTREELARASDEALAALRAKLEGSEKQ